MRILLLKEVVVLETHFDSGFDGDARMASLVVVVNGKTALKISVHNYMAMYMEQNMTASINRLVHNTHFSCVAIVYHIPTRNLYMISVT